LYPEVSPDSGIDAGSMIDAGTNCGPATLSTCFGASAQTATQFGVWQAAVADFNQDGIQDVVVGGRPCAMGVCSSNSPGEGAQIFYGTTDGGLQGGPFFSYQDFNDFSVVDVNGDGWPDLVFDDLETEINQHDGGFAHSVLQTNVPGASYVLTYEIVRADLDRDGHPDLALCTHGGIELSFGGADGYGASVGVISSGECWSLAVADLNDDGNLDIASFEGPFPYGPTWVAIRFGAGDGGFSSPVQYPVMALPAYGAIRAADLNQDGLVDLVQGSVGGLTVLTNAGGGQFDVGVIAIAPPTDAGEWSGGQLEIGDVNGDGFPDVLAADGYLYDPVYSNEPSGWDAFLFLNDGRGQLSLGQPVGSGLGNATTVADWTPAGAHLPSLIVGDNILDAIVVLPNEGPW
jgi:hypothetical protein